MQIIIIPVTATGALVQVCKYFNFCIAQIFTLILSTTKNKTRLFFSFIKYKNRKYQFLFSPTYKCFTTSTLNKKYWNKYWKYIVRDFYFIFDSSLVIYLDAAGNRNKLFSYSFFLWLYTKILFLIFLFSICSKGIFITFINESVVYLMVNVCVSENCIEKVFRCCCCCLE